MAELMNCPVCDRLFVKAFRSVCDHCHRDVEEKFQRAYAFIRKRENRRATVEEIHHATDVEEDLLYQFVREGRLQTSSFPNLTYPCESCGSGISEGRLCSKCKGNITDGLASGEKEKAFRNRLSESEKAEERERYRTYQALDGAVNKKKK
ncbi:hypothetical protein FLK61_37675 [Paenalkalicoccus suaedae]|uniref:Flagellar protein n=1 Tax=Paenalkalicoccus suaedae TaxID=2592382 RepID=A0A859FH31_9BACI|nr:TIGR03826 family flagellar region protein [Paenalkalicoccus suaedae]QKS72361.1 hypothetical protein FLK61_37675 [Paenalkalicoccus suaedae]